MKSRWHIFLGGFLVCFLVGNIACARTPPNSSLIRVAVLKEARNFNLSVRGHFHFIDPETSEVLYKGKGLRRSKVTATSHGIRVGNQEYLAGRIHIDPKRDASIYVNGRRFRGYIDIIKDQERQLLVVNTVEIEKYIKGVLYHEASNRWPMEAIKAQAVAARSYAIYRANVNKNKSYDVTSDIYSQVYGGRTSERYRTNLAVDRTRGLIMTYKGEVLSAYYHATCAGHTENVSNLWKEDLPPLKGVSCSFCRMSPHYNWKRNFQLNKIQEKLNKSGYALWLIKDIAVIKRNKSGRIETLKITTRDDKEISIRGKDFRNIVGPNLVKSNNYRITMKGYYMDLAGKGWGHGVGMCQWGANFMAQEQHNYKEILRHYYPGVEIINYETTGF